MADNPTSPRGSHTGSRAASSQSSGYRGQDRSRARTAYEQACRDLDARDARSRAAAQQRAAQRRSSSASSRGSGQHHAPAGSSQRSQQAGGRYSAQALHSHTAPAARGPRTSTQKNPRAHAASKPRRRQGAVSRKVLGIVAVAAVLVVALVVASPSGTGSAPGNSSSDMSESSGGLFTSSVSLPTPIMAECDGIELHSAVAMEDLTEILIHNASYSYALELTTQLTEATNTEVMASGGTGRDASAQPTGDEWMTGEFIRCYRSGNAGPTLSAIDCGGAVGTQVYAPVSGTVVLVKEYKLYDEYDDIQIHIQPEGRDDLDVVMIHLTDACVEAGDTVVAGETPVARIRDVYAYIGESMQLKDYTAADDNGNHTHIQVNDATNEEYHGLDDLKES